MCIISQKKTLKAKKKHKMKGRREWHGTTRGLTSKGREGRQDGQDEEVNCGKEKVTQHGVKCGEQRK